LESIEKAKIKRREAMAVILDKFNEVNTLQVEYVLTLNFLLFSHLIKKCNTAENSAQRMELQKMVKDELEKWDNLSASSPSSHAFASRAASPNSPFSPSDLEVNVRKSAYRQQ
jgi:hypothetical protein